MSKPLILLTCGRQNHGAAMGSLQSVYTGVNIDYVDSVVAAGGAPIVLPRHGDADGARAAVDAADALLLTGGGDVSPLTYGQEPHRAVKLQDPTRDANERAAIERALARGIPILGICRGIQILNVALGGTLIQDIPSQVSGSGLHYASPADATVIHSIDIEPGSLLSRVFGTTSTGVNSYHHQAADTIGTGLRVVARAKDGVVEGLESSDGKPILAVQFHPEELAGKDPLFLKLFQWVVDAAKK
jgi:gamma-glutamyl-gamma-aminobutyrate hydrolase PuuD